MPRQFTSVKNTINHPRTSFQLPHDKLTTMNCGYLYPLDLIEVLPGDTFNQDFSFVARTTSSLIRPIMANLYLDTYTFFVPLRILQDRAENVFANQSSNRWAVNNVSSLAHFTEDSEQGVQSGRVYAKTVADYLGIPPRADSIEGLNVLPFRAYAHIWNEWFRKETAQDMVSISSDDKTISSEQLNNYDWSVTNYTGKLAPVNKYVDKFTSCTVSPQLGPAIPFASTNLPVIVGGMHYFGTEPMTMTPYSTSEIGVLDFNQSPSAEVTFNTGMPEQGLTPNNLWASVAGATVNDLRMQTSLQRMVELDSQFGTRYREYLLGHYGVNNGDARMQIPEFITGSHSPISIQSVTQTAGATVTVDDSPAQQFVNGEDLGSVAGLSVTSGANQGRFVKSFTEHGYLMTVGCIRYKHTYAQGLDPLFGRIKREHFFDPCFAYLGNQPIYMEEIYLDGASGLRNTVFGYNEAWTSYRTIMDSASGEFRLGSQVGLADLWTLVDKFSNAPTVSGLIKENPTRLDSVLTVPSTSQDQFALNIHFNTSAVRVLPAYSEPSSSH